MAEGSRRSGNKVGSNKGILRSRKERRREEAEARNARTPRERTRAYRKEEEHVR